ncbi:hypothetical protein [Nostoc sp.]|uniref:hypothetical protein n=1 Tax=Nostoc sp. TaxID=1180 RepID=UPI002FF4954D
MGILPAFGHYGRARRPPHKKLEPKVLKLLGLNTTFRVPNPIFQVPNTTFQVLNPIFQVLNPIFQVPNPIFRVPNPIFRVANTTFRVANTTFRVANTIFRVPISKDGHLSLSNEQYYLKASCECVNCTSEGYIPLARV